MKINTKDPVLKGRLRGMKGRKHSEETKELIRQARLKNNPGALTKPWLGKHHSDETISKIKEKRKLQVGEKIWNWKGQKAGYVSKHHWVRRHWGRADYCESKECKGISTIFDWANITGEYKRERSDWKRLCRQCHMKFDKQHEKMIITKKRNRICKT